jgi:uncharacterized protein (TIGR02270 family)
MDEAAFLWGHWEHALRQGSSPIFHFADGLDERLLANEEELSRTAPDVLSEWFEVELAELAEGNAVAALALALLTSGARSHEDQVAAALEFPPKHRPQIVRALEVCWRDLDGRIVDWLRGARSESTVAALLRVLAWRRYRFGTELEPFLRHPDAEVRAAALLCSPWTTAPTGRWAEANLRSSDEQVRQAAWEAALWLSPATALPEIRQAFDHLRGSLDFAMVVLAVSGNPADLNRLEQTLADPSLRRQALWALGLSGWPHAAELCLRYLRDDTVADIAAEGFEAISGIRVGRTPVPLPEESEIPEEAEVPQRTRWSVPAMAGRAVFDERAAISAWESQKRKGEAGPGRILRGSPLTAESLGEALQREPLRRRHVRALELGLRSAGEARFETLTWGWQQVRELRSLKIPKGISCQIPLDQAGR